MTKNYENLLKKQIRLQRKTLSQQSCCFGCLLLILLFFFGGPILSFLGLAAIVTTAPPPSPRIDRPDPPSAPAPQTPAPSVTPTQPTAPEIEPNKIGWSDDTHFHLNKSCYRMASDSPVAITAGKIRERALQPCPTCTP